MSARRWRRSVIVDGHCPPAGGNHPQSLFQQRRRRIWRSGTRPKSSNIGFMRFLLRVLVSAAALGVATWAVSGIELQAGSTWSRVGTLIAVALIFGIINATLKPLIKVVGCAFYVLTLGLVALVVNGLLL